MGYKEKVKELIGELGITQAEAENILGYSRGAISMLMSANYLNAVKKIFYSLSNFKEKEELKKRLIKKYAFLNIAGINIESVLENFEKKIDMLEAKDIIKMIEEATGLGRTRIAKAIGMSRASLYGKNPNLSTKKALEFYFLKSFYSSLLENSDLKARDGNSSPD